MRSQAVCLFPEAATYPDFFNRHLTDPNRILKVVTGEACWARAFYFQLLKAVFEGDAEQQSVDYGQNLLNLGNQAKQKVRDPEIKEVLATSLDIIAYFMSKLNEDPQLYFEDYINQNPDVDQAFIRILIATSHLAGMDQYSSLDKIKHGAQLFNFHAYEFDKGIKFQQSDTFLYVQNEATIYIVFLNLVSSFETDHAAAEHKHQQIAHEQQQQIKENNQKQATNQQKKSEQNQSLSPLNMAETQEIKKQSPVDYLFTNKFRSESSNQPKIHKQSKQQNKSESENENESRIQKSASKTQQNNLEFTLGNNNSNNNQSVNNNSNNNSLGQSQPFKILNSRFVKHADTVEENIQSAEFKNASRESIVEERLVHRSESSPNENGKISAYFRSDKLQDNLTADKQQIFYKPVDKNINKQVGVTSSEKQRKKDAFDAVNESEKGTFYRKFTDTRILNLISEPYRTKVKMLKNRFVGMHTRNHRTAVMPTQYF